MYVSFGRGRCIIRNKNTCFSIWRGFSTFLKDLSHPWEGLRRELLNNWFAERCDFFQWRPTSSDQLQACIQKRSCRLDLICNTCLSTSSIFLLVELIFFLRYLGETNPTNLARKRSRPLNIISDKSLLFGVAMSTCLCFSIHMCISLLAGTNVSSAFGAFQGDKFLVVTMFKFRNSNIRKKWSVRAAGVCLFPKTVHVSHYLVSVKFKSRIFDPKKNVLSDLLNRRNFVMKTSM